MDDAEYARLCAQPDVMRRPALRATHARLRRSHPELAQALEAVLVGRPVPKPVEHDGGPDSDFLFLDLSDEEVDAITEAIGDMEASLAQDEATAGTELSTVTTLHDQWLKAESSRSDAG